MFGCCASLDEVYIFEIFQHGINYGGMGTKCDKAGVEDREGC